jgi:hypothetical protein
VPEISTHENEIFMTEIKPALSCQNFLDGIVISNVSKQTQNPASLENGVLAINSWLSLWLGRSSSLELFVFSSS